MKKVLPLIAIGLTAAAVAGCGGGGSSASGGSTAPSSPTTSAQASGAAVLPVPRNPIVSKSTAPGLTVTKALVENNVSPDTGKGVVDHLEISLKNSSPKPADQIAVYYAISDAKTGTTEGYYTKLTGLTIAPGATAVVNFDDTGAVGHYPVNTYSLYYTDKNALVIDVTASAAGLKPATFSVNKDAGGAEAGVE